MNSSHLSVYDNYDPNLVSDNEKCGNEAIALVVSDILKVVQNGCPVNYCPFCTLSFCTTILLQEHLLTLHYAFLWDLTNRTVNLVSCPLCPGKFAGQHLVVKHSLSYHGQVIVDTYFPKCNGLLLCIFCRSAIQTKCMPAHIEEIHALLFVDWFNEQFKLKSECVSGLMTVEDVGGSEKLSPSLILDELNVKLNQLKVETPTKSPKSILKKQGGNQGRKKQPVRRVLSFADDNKENIPTSIMPVNELELKGGEVTRRNSSDTTWGAVLRDSRFRCGKCSLFFPNHCLLTSHVKKEHKTLSFKPFYQCGVCSATFFKSSYLRKHSYLHSLKKIR